MTRQEKGLICMFLVLGTTSIVNMSSNIFECFRDSDPYHSINRISSIIQTFFLFVLAGCGFVHIANRIDDNENKIIEQKQIHQRNAGFFGGRARYLPPPQIVVDRMEIEGQADQVEGQPRQARRG